MFLSRSISNHVLNVSRKACSIVVPLPLRISTETHGLPIIDRQQLLDPSLYAIELEQVWDKWTQ